MLGLYAKSLVYQTYKVKCSNFPLRIVSRSGNSWSYRWDVFCSNQAVVVDFPGDILWHFLTCRFEEVRDSILC